MYESLPSRFLSLHNKGLHTNWKATNRINPPSVDSFRGAGPTESGAIALVRNSFNLRGDWGAASRDSPPFLNTLGPLYGGFKEKAGRRAAWGWAAFPHTMLLPLSHAQVGQQDLYCW